MICFSLDLISKEVDASIVLIWNLIQGCYSFRKLSLSFLFSIFSLFNHMLTSFRLNPNTKA